MRITAIHGGGDWADASADYLVLPEWLDVDVEHDKYREWFRAVYNHPEVKYQSFTDWLRRAGAREPLEEELTIFFND